MSSSKTPPRTALDFGDRVRRWRADLISDPAMQRRLAKLPLLNRIAGRKTRSLFDLTAGFVYSQVLFACVQLDLFRLLARTPKTTAQIAAHADLDLRAAELLLTAAAELAFIRQDRSKAWHLADFGAVIGANRGIVAMVEHHEMLYRDLADPVALLRGLKEPTETSAFWSYAGGPGRHVSDDEAGSYSELMALSQDFVIEQVLGAYPVLRHDIVLDIGGGSGAFLEAVGQQNPHARLWLYDLPAVVPHARARFSESTFSERIKIHSGNASTDPLPAGADLMTFIRVLCDHDDDAALALLRNARAAMPAKGKLLIAEAMAGPEGGGGRAAAYFSFYFLAMKSGRCRSPEQLASLLRKAGFSRIEKHRTRQPLFANVIVAGA